jgi:hypothetical protein
MSPSAESQTAAGAQLLAHTRPAATHVTFCVQLKPTSHPQLLHLLLVLLDVHCCLDALGVMHGGCLCCNCILNALHCLAADAHVVLPVKRNQLGFMRDLRLLCCLRNKRTITDMSTRYKSSMIQRIA